MSDAELAQRSYARRMAFRASEQAPTDATQAQKRVSSTDSRSRKSSAPKLARRRESGRDQPMSRPVGQEAPGGLESLGPNLATMQHRFRDSPAARGSGSRRWEHLLTKTGNALDELPPVPGGTSKERLERFRRGSGAPSRSSATAAGAGEGLPETHADDTDTQHSDRSKQPPTSVSEPTDLPDELHVRLSAAGPSITHLPQNERLEFRLDEAKVGRPSREIRRRESGSDLASAGDVPPAVPEEHGTDGTTPRRGSSLWRWQQLQRKLNKESF
eukprot:m.382222 g.382222  ORF g.382222 m.382222 type:complete len:272 (-) comp28256_c0_seq3:92-907(-)